MVRVIFRLFTRTLLSAGDIRSLAYMLSGVGEDGARETEN